MKLSSAIHSPIWSHLPHLGRKAAAEKAGTANVPADDCNPHAGSRTETDDSCDCELACRERCERALLFLTGGKFG